MSVDGKKTEATPADLAMMVLGYWTSMAIAVAAKLGVADLLTEGKKSSDEVAKITGTNSAYLYRLMRALASVGVFEELEGRVFALSPLGQFLRSDHPNSLRSFATMHGLEWHWRSWGKLGESVETGRPSIEIEYGKNLFEYLSSNPDALANFSKTMEELTSGSSAAIAAAYDFSKYSVIADVGGSQGELLFTILKSVPSAKGILFDLPDVVANAQKNLVAEKKPLLSRVTYEGGSFFETFPRTADICILKYILHDWDDDRSIQILKTFKKTSKPNSKIALVEQLLPPGPGPSRAKLVDLEMMAVTPGGRERTEDDFRKLFLAAGLKIDRIVPTGTPFFVIEGSSI